jgi:hypothetical protein
MRRDSAPALTRLNPAEQRALSSFLAGRLPAGRLHEELLRARSMTLEGEAPMAPPLAAEPAGIHAPALHAA